MPRAALLSLLVAGTLGATASAATAAVSPTQQWLTGGGSTTASGQSFDLQFGSTGETGSVGVTTVGAVGFPGVTDALGTNLNSTLFQIPDPPAGSRAVGQGVTNPGSAITEAVTLNKPLIAPIFHVENLDGSTLQVSGSTTTGDPIALTTLVKNDILGVSGNTLNTSTRNANQVGCQANDGTNPNGGCGSFQMGPGPVQSFTLNDVGAIGDGWLWSLSFPLAPLTKSFSPATIQRGGTSKLTFTISNPNNPGAAPLSPLDFTDALPAGLTIADTTVTDNGSCGSPNVTAAGGSPLARGATSVTASNISLAVGATCTITVDVTASDPGSYVNDDSNLSSTVGNVDPETRTTLTVTPSADLSIVKTATSSPAVPGSDLTYQLVVRNHGPDVARNASITDSLPAGLTFESASPGCSASGQTVTCAVGDLASGATQTYSVTARVDSQLGAGTLANTATTTSDTPDPDPSNNSSRADVPVDPEADLAIVKRALSDRLVPGRELAYELTVTNHGPSPARGVRVSDPLPSGLSFVSASDGCSFASGTVSCAVGELASGRSVTFRVVTRVAASVTAGSVTNSATVTSITRDPDPHNNRDTERVPSGPEADLAITKVPSVDHVAVGGQLFYTLLIKNNGPSDAQRVVVTDAAAPGLTLLSAQGSQGASCTVAASTVTCGLGTLAAGGTAQVLVSARADQAGELTNRATVESPTKDPDPDNNHDERRVTGDPPPTPQPADVGIVKTANRRSVLGAGLITYTLKVTNHGPGAAPGTEVIDTPSLPLKVRSVRASQGSCTKTAPLRCALGTLRSGQTVTIKVVAQPLRAGTLKNSASVTSDVPDTNPRNNIDGANVTVRGLLKITKAASAKTVRAGGTLSYRITVTNASSFALRSVKVCDKLPDGLVYRSATPKAKLSKGTYCWTIKTLGAKQHKAITVRVRVLNGVSGRKVNVATATAPNARGARSRAATSTAAIRVLGATAGRSGGVTG
jgi:uncharacterized repeat protein (TIGR01451 family)